MCQEFQNNQNREIKDGYFVLASFQLLIHIRGILDYFASGAL